MLKKIIFAILIIISIIGLIWSFRIFMNEQVYLDVNSSNRELINQALPKSKTIKKLSVGQGFHTGEINIYYSSGEKEKIQISEGNNITIGEDSIDSYIRENGYSLDKIAIVIGIASLMLLIGSAIYFIKK